MKRTLLLFGVAFLVLLPFFSNNYIVRLATIMLMYIVLSTSWNFIGGFTGYPSFATAAFFGFGAYTGGICQLRGIPLFTSWCLGSLSSVLLAIFLGVIILRLKGHYFAISSLAVVEVLREIANTSTSITGGGTGLNLPILRVDVALQAKIFFYPMLILGGIAVITAYYVRRGSLGFGLHCIKQNEDAANMVGINTVYFKIISFALSGVFVGCAGAIYASWVNYIEPGDVFDVLLSLKPIVMVLLGGMRTVAGPVIGAMVYLFIEEVVWRNFLHFHAGLLGIIIVLLIMYLPNGLFSPKQSGRDRRPKSHPSPPPAGE